MSLRILGGVLNDEVMAALGRTMGEIPRGSKALVVATLPHVNGTMVGGAALVATAALLVTRRLKGRASRRKEKDDNTGKKGDVEVRRPRSPSSNEV